MTAREIIRTAKQLLINEGYIKNLYELTSGDDRIDAIIVHEGSNPCGTKRCLIGALTAATTKNNSITNFCVQGHETRLNNDNSSLVIAYQALNYAAEDTVERNKVLTAESHGPAEAYAEAESTTLGDVLNLLDKAEAIL